MPLFNRHILLPFGVFTLILCSSAFNSNNNTSERQQADTIGYAAQQISDCFLVADSMKIKSINKYLQADQITVIIRHSLDPENDTLILKGQKKRDFFYKPAKYNAVRTRVKSNFLGVNKNCAQFGNEGISHTSLYIRKLCFVHSKGDLLLQYIYLLDGD